jgi:hypothetical protein
MNSNFRPMSLSEGVLIDTLTKRKNSKLNLPDFYVKLDDEENNNPNTNNNIGLDLTIQNKINITNTQTNTIQTIKIKSNPNSKTDLTQETIINNLNVNISYNEENIIISTIKKIIPSEKTLVYMLKKLFMFMFHLTLISIFEIFFFFMIVSVFENKAIVNLVMDFFKKVPSMCENLTIPEKINFTMLFDSLANKTKIINSATISKLERQSFNNKLYFNAWMYFLIIVAIDIALLGVKFYYKIKINFKKILIENMVMILILGLYEYMFFKSIILIYQNISQQELVANIVGEFTMCFI